MSSEPAYAVFVVALIILILAVGFIRRRNAMRRLREQEEQELQQQQGMRMDAESMGRTFYSPARTGGVLLYRAEVRPPAAARLNAHQNEEDNKPEYLPPYQPPSKPLADPPAYSEATAGPSIPATPERAAHA
ncbi:hypothetical protein J3B02_004237 [Coemansia erecta]|uniref:Uncharacterized protein n=1 Tax=Coemansia asiatica TaxID=1052880 RepID=A0A9W7XP47_9FUNG|nr:hypothetical protein LPJ64_001340 [Coemansia asiatica]KAJ2847144.1 hypothetical protein J3B02_004237 [Coemansia erecta]